MAAARVKAALELRRAPVLIRVGGKEPMKVQVGGRRFGVAHSTA